MRGRLPFMSGPSHYRKRSPHPPQCAHWGTFPPGGRLAGGHMGPPLRIPSRFGGGGKPPPYKVFTTEAFALPSQAQPWNCNRRNFPSGQGPVARREFRPATQILRAGNFAKSSRYASPVMGSGADSPCQGEMSRSDRGGRVGEYERVSAHLSRPWERFAFFFAMEKEGHRPQAAKLPHT